MTNPKEKDKPVIKTRNPKKTTRGIFDNLRKLPHPIEEILGLEHPETVDAHTIEVVDAKTPTQPLWTPTIEPLKETVDAKTPTSEESGRPQSQSVDAHKRDRHRRDAVRHHLRLNPAISKRFKVFCAETGIDFQEFVELAGVHYIENFSNVGVHSSEGVDAKTPIDDRRLMTLYKTTPLIINLYLKYNPKNKWKVADDRIACKYNDDDPKIIEIGIIQTLLNARFKRINSFKYFINEIEEIKRTALGSETLEVMLHSAHRWWNRYTQGELDMD